MTDAKRVRVVEDGGHVLAFTAEDMALRLRGPDLVWTALNALNDVPPRAQGGEPRDSSSHAAHTSPEPQTDSRPRIDRLTLTVSNSCNLGCSYCYASGGTYYNRSGFQMDPQTAMNAINRAAATYSHIEHINFFGGEPTLNLDIIEMSCEYVKFLHSKGVLTNVPSFGITTNGYLLDERCLAVLERHGFSITLSLDGPKEIHDRKRPTKSGAGTYDQVAANARTLIARGFDLEFECTYTADHYRHGIAIVDLMDFFHAEFGCRTLHCQIAAAHPTSPEYVPVETRLALMGDAIEYSLINLSLGIEKTVSTAVRLMNAVTYRTPIGNYCPAGRSEITVNADGELYACFMLMQSSAYSFGTVNPPRSAAKRSRLKVIQPETREGRDLIEGLIQDSDKSANVACQRCWAQPLCFGCQGEDFERLGGRFTRSEVPGVSAFCDEKRALIDRFLQSIVRAHVLTTNRLEPATVQLSPPVAETSRPTEAAQ